MTYGVFDAVKDTLTGKAQYVPKEVKQGRLAICTECSHFRPISRQCGICGCFMDAKTSYVQSECAQTPPKWSAL